MTAAARVGFFGYLGAGNLGNEGSLEAVLAYLRAEQPNAALDCLCTGPDKVTAQHGLPAAQMRWYDAEHEQVPVAKCVKVPLGMIIDAFRTASWVRRHDAVIVPGMGVLEASLPVRPWHYPYSMFLLSASGRLFRTKVAFVCVGSGVIRKQVTRQLIVAAARLAYYRSYRDSPSREAMRQMGLDTSSDPVYPDLAFALPSPHDIPVIPGAVGVGVMNYHGSNDDRGQADEIRASYIEKMTDFVMWLLDKGRPVRLFATDVHDEPALRKVVDDVRALRPGLEPSQLIAERSSSLDELMRQLAAVETVVASRYHNVLCALKLSKPTLSIGYAMKFEALMAEMGMAEFCQSSRTLNLDLLFKQFGELESRSAQVRRTLTERNADKARLLEQQFATLSAFLFQAAGPPETEDAAARRHAYSLEELS